MIGMFGDVPFSVSSELIQTIQELKRTTSARYTDHETIGTKPKREFLGPGLDELSFSMLLSAFRGASPVKLEEQLRKYCEKGEEQPFILGGKNYGDFCIEQISSAYEVVENHGDVLQAKIDVTLKEYQ